MFNLNNGGLGGAELRLITPPRIRTLAYQDHVIRTYRCQSSHSWNYFPVDLI
jgi:hypothetical protein